MRVRELTSDEQIACQNKAAQKVDKLLSDSQNESPKNKFDKLYLFFEIAAERWDHFGEHFSQDAEGHIDFNQKDDQHVVRSDEEVVVLLKGRTCYEETMRATIAAMSGLEDEEHVKLSRVNGTSMIFNQCVERLNAGPKRFVAPMESNIVLPQFMAALYK